MQRDAQQDPAKNPDALRAKLLADQVCALPGLYRTNT